MLKFFAKAVKGAYEHICGTPAEHALRRLVEVENKAERDRINPLTDKNCARARQEARRYRPADPELL